MGEPRPLVVDDKFEHAIFVRDFEARKESALQQVCKLAFRACINLSNCTKAWQFLLLFY